MAYYVDRAQTAIYFTRDGSPGGRNYLADKMKTYFKGEGSGSPGL